VDHRQETEGGSAVARLVGRDGSRRGGCAGVAGDVRAGGCPDGHAATTTVILSEAKNPTRSGLALSPRCPEHRVIDVACRYRNTRSGKTLRVGFSGRAPRREKRQRALGCVLRMTGFVFLRGDPAWSPLPLLCPCHHRTAAGACAGRTWSPPLQTERPSHSCRGRPCCLPGVRDRPCCQRRTHHGIP
jgi:hypothetical protein